MSEYLSILVWIGLVALLANQFNLKKTELVCGDKVERYVPWFAFLVFAPIIWIAGQRQWFGDTGAYIDAFSLMPDTFAELTLYIPTIQKDAGFYTLSAIFKIIFGSDYTLYFTVFALMQGLALIVIFRKYSVSYILSVFLFVASTDYLSWMMNGMRQFCAVTIIFVATALMLKKKYVPLVLVILLASTMHQSALIMIPLVFIAQGKAWNKKTLLFIVAALFVIAYAGEFTDILDSALQDTQYTNVVSDYTTGGDDGTNPIRVLIYSVPAIMSFVGRKYIWEADNPLVDFCTNMSIISMGLYIVSIFTSGVFMGRLPIYVSLYGYILLPWMIENMFTKESKKIIYGVLVVGYLGFYYIQLHSVWGLI